MPIDTLGPDANGLIWLGTIASLGAGLATGLGALPVLFFTRSMRPTTSAAILGFGAGVMLAATSFSLIVPALASVDGRGASPLTGAAIVAAGVLLGALVLLVADRYIPHEHFLKGREGPAAAQLRRIWLFVLAITLHNFPEGLAVGVSFGSGDAGQGMSLALGIGLQNLPEGLVVAMALHEVGYSRARAFLVALGTGLVEPVGGVLGVSAVTVFGELLPWGLAFAAGAMLFVVSGEIIPECHRDGQGRAGTLGLMLGFVVMLMLDVAVG